MRKVIAMILTALLLSLVLTGVPVFAQETAYQAEAINYQYFGTSPTGLIDYVMLDMNGNVIDNKGLIPKNDRDRAILIPSAYDLRNVDDTCYVTSVKNQGIYGTCWSFASIGALESNLIKQGLADTSIDLSELHTAWYAYTPDTVPESTTYGDGVTNIYSSNIYNEGGWAKTAYGIWGSAEGVQQDVNAPYKNASDEDYFTETQRKESYYRVKSAYEIPVNNTNAVKSSLMENGAMYISFWLNWSCFNASRSTYYNASYDSSNDPDPVNSGGHAVLLVGWNDDYSASNFKTTPPGNGAWLCRNSWGEGSGEGGYFWISYYNHEITGFTTFIGTTGDNYDNYNQYDRTGYQFALGGDGIWLSNVFTAQNASTLEAVSFRTESKDGTDGTAGFNYKIYIYKNLPVTVTNPKSDTPAAAMSGHSDYGGYFTVNLPSPLALAPGEKYSVVLSLESSTTFDSGGRVYYGSEKRVGSSSYNAGVNTVAGRSFWSNNGTTWVDTFGTEKIWNIDLDGNFPIKALTNDVDTTYAATRALVQTQLDQTDGAAQGTASAEQWNAFIAARTRCQTVYSDSSASKTDLNNAIIRLKDVREKASGISYPSSGVFTYTVSGTVATITGYNGTASCVTIPKSLDGCSVEVEPTAFNNKTGLKIIYVEGNLNSIASTAFSGCTNLQFVYFMGNAPTVTGTPGTGSPIGVTTYYKSTTSGWTASPWGGNSTPVVPGDLNADNAMNMNDAVGFVQRLAQTGTYTLRETAAIDITRDGAVNMSDIVKLVQALANTSIVLQ